MYILGIETSCDETAASIVKDGRRILSNVVASSLSFHKKYGGVVPEIAFRMQLETITEVVDSTVREAGMRLKDMNLISVTCGPGLLGSLLVGISFAKAISLSLGIPLVGVNHLHSHIYASFLQPQKRPLSLKLQRTVRRSFNEGGRKISAKDAKNFCGLVGFCDSMVLPFVALVVSGGHTSLFYVRDLDKIKLLGATQDDACGEAFDKVAKILRLGYPGGPLIEKLAKKSDSHKIRFSCSNTKNPLDFSFSGIKTAVLYYVQRHSSSDINEIAASFQEAVINTLIDKSLLACRIKKTKRLVVGGGVAANSRLRERFYRETQERGLMCYFPSKELCVDNAAMVAGLGYQLFKRGYRADLDLNVDLN